MEDNDKIIDQSQLAQDVANQIKYSFFDYFLVKPLEPVKVMKEFSTPVDTTLRKDENGIEARDFKEVATEVKQVDSDYRKGVVIKCPTYYGEPGTKVHAQVGDIVIFRDTAGLRFDLVKDSRLLRLYDILGIEETK